MWHLVLDCLFPRLPLLSDDLGARLPSHPICFSASALRDRGIHSLDRLAAGIPYTASSGVRQAITACKYQRLPALAEPLARVAASALPLLLPHPDAVLCPVPLHWWRALSRGFNQAELLADHLASGRMSVLQLLRRRRPTGHQAHRTGDERRHALAHAFVAAGEVPLHVILIDDVATTGSTLDACAKALRAAGAQTVQALVVASA